MTLKRFKQILKWSLVSLLLLLLAVYIFINTPFGQNWIGRQVTKRLSRDLQTQISIDNVNFSLLNRMHLQGVLIRDRTGDTLLYAGNVSVRITDWFIFKKQAELKYIGLENALVKFQRTDSIWRQQFIFDYFATPKTDTAKKKAGIVFNLKLVELKNVTFLKKDEWLGNDLRAHVGSMLLNANDISLSGNHYDVNTLELYEPDISIHNYEGRRGPRPVLTGPEKTAEEELSDYLWNQGGMQLRIANMKIVNGSFRNDRDTDRPPFPYFDGKHIYFSGINAEMTNAGFVGDTVYSYLKLSARERSGLEVKQMTADLSFKPTGMEFRNLDLQTNRSRIRDYFSMSYDDMRDMSDFLNKVEMAAVFDDAYVDSDDIAFFAPALADWKKTITLRGNVRGPVSDLVGRNLFVEAGSSTVLSGDISLRGLPDINQTFIDFTARDFRTTYGDAVTFVPAIRKVTTPDLRQLGYVQFRGNFTGFIRDFVTFGTIETNLGSVKSDLNMKLPARGVPVYSGSIATDGFKLGQFLHNPDLGMISMTGSVKGTGFNERNRQLSFDGLIRYADYRQYRYNNVVVQGTLNKNLFEGVASIRDPNADLDLNGIIDFNQPDPRFDLVADVRYLNLQPLGLTEDDYRFQGQFDLDFTAGQQDIFLGDARITGAEITRNGQRLPFDSLVVRSVYTDSGKTLIASSNEFEARVTGDFNLRELPAAVSVVLHRYYPSYIPLPARYPRRNQDIRFYLKTYYAEEYVALLDSSLGGLNNSEISGRLNLAENSLVFEAAVPQFRYQQYNFENVDITATGDAQNLFVKGSAHNIMFRNNDSVTIPIADFTIQARNDSSRVNLITEANRSLDTANISALVLTYRDGIKVEFDRSTFTLNGKSWVIDENGEIAFRRNTPFTGILQLSEGEQRIVVRTEPSGQGWNNLKMSLTKLNMGDLAPFFLPKNRLEGLISGNVTVEDPTNNLRIYSTDLQTEFLRLDNDSLGAVRISDLLYEKSTGLLTAKGNTLNDLNHLAFDVTVNVADPNAVNNKIALQARNFQLSVLERFLGTLFTDIQGYLTGNVDITGAFRNLTVTGKGRLKDAGLKVLFTQVFYDIADTDIELKSDEINLDGIVLRDTITGNPVYITGGIEHQSFRNMFYNLDISTRRPGTTSDQYNLPVQLLATSYKDNQQFYGDVKGTGSMSLLGPQSAMYMKIDAAASTLHESFVTIPPVSSRVSGGMADFLVERKYGREMEELVNVDNTTNIIYDVDVTANPNVTVKVVLDELTGDELSGRGSGTLNIRSGTAEPLTLRGRFDIEEGNYLFTFQSFFKKPFELRRGVDNYIEWNGDPNDARINFEAVYRAERVSYATLANSLGLATDIARVREDVFVVARLTDQLFKPTISFSLDFPSTSPAITDPELALIVQQMQKNPNELNTQVTYLIVFNSFAPVELGSGATAGNPLGSTLSNTISSILLNVISDQINKLFGNLLKNDKFDIRLNTALYNRNLLNEQGFLNIGTNVNLSIGRSFFNNRFIISTGLGVEAPLQQTNLQQGLQFLPDVTMEWLINPSGTLRATFFYRENTDYLAISSGQRNAKRVGGSIAFRKDFDRLRDLFKSRRAQKTNPPQPLEPAVESTEKNEEPKKEED